MPRDEEDPESSAPSGQPLPPDDRLWRHPSEVGGGSRNPPRSRRWGFALTALGGAAAAVAVLALTGLLTGDEPGTSGVIERVATPAFATVPVITHDQPRAGGGPDGLVTVESGDEATGTGIVLRSDGHVVTAASLIGDAERVVVETADGQRGGASVVGQDRVSGLAVLAVGWLRDRPTAVFGTALSLTIGDEVMTATADGMTTGGVVSDLSATAGMADTVHHGLVRTTGSLDPMGVGGPVLDGANHVVGVALWSDPSPATWSVPIKVARRVAADIIVGGRARHSWLGVRGADGDGGPELREVAVDSPAELAGLLAGDVLIAIDDKPMAAMADVVVVLQDHRPGDAITIDYRRGDQEHTCEADLVEREI